MNHLFSAIKAFDTASGRGHRIIYLILHIIVLVLSVYLVVSISLDTFKGINFYAPRFVRTQFFICMAFMLDFFIELGLSKKKWQYLRNNLIFFLFSIPYLTIFSMAGVHFSPMAAYLVQYIPLLRGGYALAIIVGWFTYNRATSMFVTYLFSLVATAYFASLIFYLFEHKINKGVSSYGDALWWALMDMTTVGSDISPVTYVGRVLAVLLAALGMMMFPIFTVYITSLLSGGHLNPAKHLMRPGEQAKKKKAEEQSGQNNNSQNFAN